jgi:2,4-dienoyl-CoA reductase-like NADH-dependent reductase (Old Yellow Enzyme family)
MQSRHSFFPKHFDALIDCLDEKRVSAIEISYGSMEYPMNIFRGDCPLPLALEHNPLFRSRTPLQRWAYTQYAQRVLLPAFLPFTPMYNLPYAARARERTDIPIITVGGARTKNEMEAAIAGGSTDMVAMSRPFLREPDLAAAMRRSEGDYSSKCKNCNICVLMCDAGRTTKCYQRTHESLEGHVS